MIFIVLGVLIFLGFQFQPITVPIIDSCAKAIKEAWHYYEDNIQKKED